MKELALLAATVAAAVGIAAGAVFGLGDRALMVSPPEAVAEEFMRELATRRYDIARERLAEGARERGTADALRALFEPVRERIGPINTIDAAPLSDPGRGDTQAWSRAEVRGDRGAATFTIALSREKGLWVVSDWTLTADTGADRRLPAQRAQDRVAELRHVVRLARRDDVAVLHDRAIDVQAAGILDVDRDRRPARDGAAAQRVGGDEHLRAVTDRADRLAGGHRVAHEIDQRRTHAHLVRRVAAGDDHRVEVGGPGRTGRELRPHDGAALPGVVTIGKRPDDRHLHSGVAQPFSRARQLDVLEPIFNKHRHSHGFGLYARCYDRRSMQTLLINGSTAVPEDLREIVERGSTSLVERRASEVAADAALDADRVVFWAAKADADLRALAGRCARAEARERREVIVFITPDADPQVAGLAPHEVYIWPRDEDRLKMAFMTGA